VVFDLDGTREAARVSCLAPDRSTPPGPIDRLDDVCAAFLQRAQAWTGGAHPHRHQSGPSFPMARLVGPPGQRSLPGGAASGRSCHHALPARAHQFPQARARLSTRRTIWHRGRALRCGGLCRRSARQRVHRARSSSRAGASAPAERLSSNNARKERLVRSRDLCPNVPLGAEGVPCRVVVATR
jgi:hypothetical protein